MSTPQGVAIDGRRNGRRAQEASRGLVVEMLRSRRYASQARKKRRSSSERL